MKLKISNLGIVDTMEIDMSKPFILFTGENGTGKTYVASLLYKLVRYLGGRLYSAIKNKEIGYDVIRSSETDVSGNLEADILYDFIEKYLEKGYYGYSKPLVCELATSREEWKTELYHKDINMWYGKVTKAKESYEFNLRQCYEGMLPLPLYMSILIESAYFDGISDAHVITAERNGIYTFGHELAQWRIKQPLEAGKFEYPQTITDSIANISGLREKRNKTTVFSSLADDIEKMILHGSLNIKDDGDIQYKVEDNLNLSLNQSSSTVKTMASIVFYLRHYAYEDNLLIIDEPEINLHPKNQILIARIFVKMINAGIHLIVSTHSDYIIREINNMIMANELGDDPVVKEFGYEEDMKLSKDKFVPYVFEFNSNNRVNVRELEVDRFGFSMPSIDETINKQNNVTNTLYDVLRYNH